MTKKNIRNSKILDINNSEIDPTTIESNDTNFTNGIGSAKNNFSVNNQPTSQAIETFLQNNSNTFDESIRNLQKKEVSWGSGNCKDETFLDRLNNDRQDPPAPSICI